VIEIVLPENRARHKHLLDAMFRMRYDVVVKQWGWDVPGIEPGYDKDEFDTDQTVYMLYLSEAGDQVLGCCRFNPTSEPYMISELWPDHCDLQDMPKSSTSWEGDVPLRCDRQGGIKGRIPRHYVAPWCGADGVLRCSRYRSDRLVHGLSVLRNNPVNYGCRASRTTSPF